LIGSGAQLGGQELVARVVGGHAVELEQAAVELIRAALADNVDVADMLPATVAGAMPLVALTS